METGIYNHTRAGTIGGTLLVLILQINSTEIIKTALMAAVGAATSFYGVYVAEVFDEAAYPKMKRGPRASFFVSFIFTGAFPWPFLRPSLYNYKMLPGLYILHCSFPGSLY